MTDPTPLDDVAFLARSPHRVEVLRTLSSGRRTRPELHAEAGVPQPTLGRVLGSFEARNWVRRHSPEYGLTPLGELVAEAFADLLETVATVQRLGDVLRQLPTDEMAFDVRAFADADVWTPDPGDTLSHIRRMETTWFDADEARLLGTTLGPRSPHERREGFLNFLDGDRRSEVISSVDLFERGMTLVAETDTAPIVRAALETGRSKNYLYDGPIPLMLAIADDTAMLAPTDENGIPTAVVATENEAIRSWVHARFDDYRARSVELTLENVPLPDRSDG